MTVHTFFFITRPGINDRPMRQHGAALIGYVKDIAMAFLALLVFKGCVSAISILFTIIGFPEKMNIDILNTVPGLGIKEIKGVVRRRKMAVHAIRNKSLGIVYVT